SACRMGRANCAATSLPGASPALSPGYSRRRGRPSRRRVRSGERACRRCQRYLRSSASRSLLCFSPRPRSLSAILTGPRGLEDFLAGTQHFVQCFLKVGGALGQLLSYLRNILFEALFYLLAKELLERSVAKTFRMLCRMVGDDVGNGGAGEPLGTLIRILGQKGVERTSRPTIGRHGYGSGWSRRGTRGGRRPRW